MSRWLSDRPDKAWAERIFLILSPFWMAAVGVVMGTRAMDAWGDAGYMAFGVALMVPFWIGPLLWKGNPTPDRSFWDTHWFRFNVWIAIYTFSGSYFVTHYFFDVAGMRYEFPVTLMFDATIAGEGKGEVPLFLFPMTHAYFMTYHVTLVVALRKLKSHFGLARGGTFAAIVVLSYGMAFLETLAMDVPMINHYFGYADKTKMLLVGSAFYALLFIVSLPMVSRLDEDKPWTLGRTVLDAMAASMIAIILVDFWALFIGSVG